MEWAVWLSGIGRLDCPTCKATWADFDGVPPCETCKPVMRADNATSIGVYCQCSGPIPIGALEAMRLKRVQDIEGCLQDVQLMAAEVARIEREKRTK